MEIVLSPKAEDYLSFWEKSGDKIVLKKIAQLTRAISENPFEGIGKPEQLRHKFSGIWSRRINLEHRVVYEVDYDTITIHSLKGHYFK
jgi:toxin YoeB